VIELKEINKSYNKRHVLVGLNLKMYANESIAICGRSGSGKSTLINIIAGLLTIYSGDYFFNETQMSLLSDSKRAKFRQEEIGIITQHFDLLENRNVKANIMLALEHLKLSKVEKNRKIRGVLQYVGLEGFERKRISELSGGEKQRVAICRALIKRPKFIIADEPTGSLDEETRDQMLQIFKQMIKDGTRFIIVTHDNDVAQICDRVYFLRKGILEERSEGKRVSAWT